MFDYSQTLYTKKRISSEDLKLLKEKSNEYLNNQDSLSRKNHMLAGNLEKEFVVDESFAEIVYPYLVPLANTFHEKLHPKDKLEWHLTDHWINFQKKHEFNPLHNHSGTYSFVLWVQVPYDLKEEMQLQNCVNSNTPMNSLFSFYFPSISGSIISCELHIDKTWEGSLVLFPSGLQHMVYPFYTSDDYRISIAGNLIGVPTSKKTFSFNYR